MMEHKPNFTPRAQRAIEIAKKVAKDLRSRSISLEHLFLGILQLKAGVIHEVLITLGLDPISLISVISSKLRSDSQGTNKSPQFDKKFKQVLEIASLISQNFGHDYVGIEHLLLAMLKYEGSPINKYFKSLNIPEDMIIDEIKNYFQLSMGQSQDSTIFYQMPPPQAMPGFHFPDQAAVEARKQSKTPQIEKYTSDLTKLASQGKFDKIIGRESEILEVCETLCRRTKNNPVLLGEAGVGKTALVEGLAQLIIDNNAPEHLLDKKVLALDLSGMIAGTKYRGQFEERIKNLLEEIKKDKNIILFIDEIHTLVGAGSAEGTMDAANILKPMLARGEVRCIGATTDSEYKKTILKDSALDRRFQAVKCPPPSAKETKAILEGIISKYESFHHAEYEDGCIDLIVELAERYLPSRQFPDKAIDILDSTGAKVKIKSFSRPKSIKNMEAELEALMNQEEGLRKNTKAHNDLMKEQDILLEIYSKKLNAWAQRKFKNRIPIKKEDIIRTVSQITSIPMSELSRTESQKFLSLEKKLQQKVIGQSKAINSICKAILRSKSGLRNECKPIGSFLLLGQSGLGKTHTAKQISKTLLGENSEIIHLDMSEYSEKTASTKLAGASPGYVGYEEGSILIDKILKNPYSVILFDEIEKAHPDVIQTMLQILEEGKLTDALGRVGDFRNSIIIITGNIGSDIIHKGVSVGFGAANATENKVNEKLLEKASEALRPEFVNRLTEVIMYQPFSKEDLIKIIALELKPIQMKVKKLGANLGMTPGCKKFIADKLVSSKFGARPISRIIQKEIEDPLAELIISGKLKEGSKISFSEKNGEIKLNIREERAE